MAVKKKIDWKTIGLSVIGTLLVVVFATGIGFKAMWEATKANLKIGQ